MRPFLFLLLIPFLSCDAQTRTERGTSGEKQTGFHRIVSYTIIRQAGKPEIITKDGVIIKRSDLISEKLVQPEKALKLYGVKGAIIQNLKPGVELVTLTSIMKKYNIDKKEAELIVYVDNIKYYSEAKNILAVPTNVKSVVIATDSITMERYIDVRTGGLLHPRHVKIKL